MKLLIVAQRVDRDDPVLGFFHRWIEEFAVHCESVLVIGQAVGKHQLPKNVTVRSLRKERGWAIPLQILLFWWLLIRHRRQYDRVFVHMSPIWVVLGSPLFFVLRVRAYLWYEVRRGGAILRMAVGASTKAFSATQCGIPFSSAKIHVMHHGIDTALFSPEPDDCDPSLIVAVGRLTGSKRYPLILDCFAQLDASTRLQIVGSAVTSADQQVLRHIHERIAMHHLEGRVSIVSLTHRELPMIYRRAGLLLHACIGGLDKAVLEAMACGCPVVWSGPAASQVLPSECVATEDTFVERAKGILGLQGRDRVQLTEELRKRVVEQHSLQSLIPRLVDAMQ